MVNLTGWFARAGVLRNDNAKGPWGGRGGGDDNGSGGGGAGGNGGEGGGPRNPWAFPPDGRRQGRPGPSTLDEFLKRARQRRGGGGGGGGFGGLPGGSGNPAIWTLGIILVIALWVLFTCFHVISPQQRGVVTTFGSYSRTLNPGFQLTLPAPISTVTKVDVQQIRNEDFPTGNGENLMLTGDQNIIDLAYSVRWDIKDPENYSFQIANQTDTVRGVAESAMRAIIASVSLNEAIGSGRTGIEGRVQDLMQSILDEYNSGVRVQGVAIKQASAPAAVDDAFKDVTAAQQDAQAALNQARAYAQQKIAYAQGEAAQFDRIYEQYKLSPEVTRRRLYYETMEDVLAKSNKTIVEAPGVNSYLPLPAIQGRRAAEPQAAPQPQSQPTPQAQGGQR